MGTILGKPDDQVEVIVSKAGWDALLERYKNTDTLLVIFFSASWSRPCKAMEEPFNEMASSFSSRGAAFVKIEVDDYELREVARSYNVEAMPTFLLMKKGAEEDRVVGAKKDDLKTAIEGKTGSPPAS